MVCFLHAFSHFLISQGTKFCRCKGAHQIFFCLIVLGCCSYALQQLWIVCVCSMSKEKVTKRQVFPREFPNPIESLPRAWHHQFTNMQSLSWSLSGSEVLLILNHLPCSTYTQKMTLIEKRLKEKQAAIHTPTVTPY